MVGDISTPFQGHFETETDPEIESKYHSISIT